MFFLKIAAAIFFALALGVGQAMHGGAQIPGLMVPALILVLAGAVCLAPGALRQPPPLAPLAAVMIFLGYIIWRCLQPGTDPLLGRIDLTTALTCGLVLVSVAAGFQNPRARLWLVGSIAVILVMQVAIGLIQFTRGGDWVPLGWFSEELHRLYMDRFVARTRGSFLNPNQFAWVMGTGLLISVSFATWGRLRIWARILCIYLAVVFLAGLILAASRGALIATALGILAFGALSLLGTGLIARQGMRSLLVGSFLVLVVILGSGALVYNFTWVAQSRFQEILVPGVRSSYIEIAWREFQSAPIFGTSPGNFLYSSRLYRHEISPGDAMYTHNDWLQLLAEYGWVGFSLGFLALLLLLGNGIKRFQQIVTLQTELGERPLSNEGAIAVGTLSVAVFYAVHSIVDFNFHVPVNALLAAMVLGLLAASPKPSSKFLVKRWPRQVSRGLVVLAFLGFGGGLAWQLVSFGKSDWNVLKARNALVTGNSDVAYALSNEALKDYPDDPQWWITKAQAARVYETDTILKEMPKIPEAKQATSDEIDDPNAASDAFDDQEEISAGFDEGKRAQLLEASLAAYQRAVELRPKERQFLSEWVDSLAASGSAGPVREHSIQAIQLDPWSGYAYAKYGEALETLGSRKEALEIFRLGSNLEHGTAARAAQDRILGDEELERELKRLETLPE